MSDLTATLRVESPALALTETVAHDPTATVRPVSGAGTVPDAEAHLFSVRTSDLDRFEAGLEGDRTVEAFERVVEIDDEAVYRFEYRPDTLVLSGSIAELDGVSLGWINDGTAWTVRVWLPDRAALAALWADARERDVDVSLERVSEYTGPGGSDSPLTRAQRTAIRRAFEMGYFEEPRAATLSEVAADLGISQPAAGGRLRRGVRRLVAATVVDDAADVGRDL